MDPRRLRFVVAGVALLVIAGIAFAVSYSSGSRQSTFSFGPDLHYRIPADFAAGTTIEGQFRETSGRAVSFYLMSSAQYSSYVGGTWIGSLYGVGEAISSSISYTTPVRDTYYLVFFHGTGINDTQTVNFEWGFRTVSVPLLVAGVAFVVLAVYDFYVAFGRAPSGSTAPPSGESPKGPDLPGP